LPKINSYARLWKVLFSLPPSGWTALLFLPIFGMNQLLSFLQPVYNVEESGATRRNRLRAAYQYEIRPT